MTNFEEFLKKNRIKTKREKRLAKLAWLSGLKEAKKIVKISAMADMAEAGLDPYDLDDYDATYAKGLEDDIQIHIELYEKR